jgi:hypothetical protein
VSSIEAEPIEPGDLNVVPANEATWADLAATSTTGLVAYLTEGSQPAGRRIPVGWVAVEPRTEYPRLLGLPTVWKGRQGEDRRDEGRSAARAGDAR